MLLETFLANYGIWVGLAVYILLKDIVPFLFGKFFPGRIKSAEAQRLERVRELEDERDWQHKLENDRLNVLAEISRATQNLSVNMASTNANIAAVLTNQGRILVKQDDHHTAMMDAVGDMRAAVSVRNKKSLGSAKTI
jgi:hypothetical protein